MRTLSIEIKENDYDSERFKEVRGNSAKFKEF